ncbi:hypothetical protein M231_05734 [Tremella mesenterica]|uniref:RING-type domain-containing protein n=1 Tax=Tremella mesenterica TaxID=5217 RepID=A0A4Q1BHA5_TREME|nr:hypothetical protein M231_05734 [Tremella mesenterica]
MCAICQSALVDPVTTASCKHTFCRDCITRALAEKPQCPIDRSALTTASLRDTEQLVKLMLDELKVRCAADDCGKVMQRGLLLAHVKTCQKTLVTCQGDDCGLSMARHRLSHHRAYECFQRQMECKRCGVLLTFKSRNAHSEHVDVSEKVCELCQESLGPNPHLHAWICPLAPVPCTHNARGCASVLTRSTLAEHLETCPFERLSEFFIANDARMTFLENKFRSMDEDVGALRREIAVLREREARNRNGLGASIPRAGIYSPRDWADRRDRLAAELSNPPSELVPEARDRPAAVGPESTDTSRSSSTSSLSSASESDAATGIVNLAVPVPRRVIPHRVTSINDLSNVGSSNITPRAAADLRASRGSRELFTPSFGSHQSYADFAFNRLSELRNVPDITEALRSVVGHLAAGMDTMERRNEVRTMTETLRVLEEIGRLQAIVNTIRMQVMIDRPAPSPLRSNFSLHQPPISSQTDSNSSTRIPYHTQTTVVEESTRPSQEIPLPPGPRVASNSRSPSREREETASITESVVFSPLPQNAGSSTTSLVSANGGYPRGLPMGLPVGNGEEREVASSIRRTVQSRRMSLPMPSSFLRRQRPQGPGTQR